MGSWKTGKNSSDSIRVAWLPPSLARGYYWQPVFREFTKLFPNTAIFTALWPGFMPGYEGTITVRELPGFRFVALRRNQSGAEIGFSWAPAGILWELIRFRPSVVFASAFSIWTLYALVFKALGGARVILLWEGTSFGTACLDSAWRLRIRRVLARFVDAAVTNSRDGARYLKDVVAIPESKVLRHPYEVPETGVLCSGGHDQRLIKLNSRPAFLFVGSLIKRKGWRYLLEAAKQLAEEEVGPFSVVFAGSGEEADELRKLSSAFGLGGVVKLVGQVPYQNLGALFRACDVFVLPTLEDTWGMVVLEAMAIGKPVLCSEYAGAKDMVEHGGNGFIFDPYRPRELANYMARFIRQPALVADFGARSREIIAPYTAERAAKVLASLVWKLLGREDGQPPSTASPGHAGGQGARQTTMEEF